MADIRITGLKSLARRVKAIDKSIKISAIMHAAAVTASGDIQERSMKGKSVSGSSFKPYSTEPMYVSPKTPGMRGAAKPPVGKNGSQWFKYSGRTKTGKAMHKSRYYEGGYEEVRRELGRDNSNGRLVLSGKMMANMTAKPFLSGARIYFPRKNERDKADGNNERYDWFGLSQKEAKAVVKSVTMQLIDIVKRNSK